MHGPPLLAHLEGMGFVALDEPLQIGHRLRILKVDLYYLILLIFSDVGFGYPSFVFI